MKSQSEELHEDSPLLSKEGSDDAFLGNFPDNADPESADNKIADRIWFGVFAFLVIVVFGTGFTAVFLGKVDALIIGVDNNGFICGTKGTSLKSYGYHAAIAGDLKWSRFMNFSYGARSCVDSCPPSRYWSCTGLTNSTVSCAVTQAENNSDKETPVFGYCVSQNAVSQLLDWMVGHLSPRQFTLVVSYWYVLAILATIVTITAISNIVLALLLFCMQMSWKIWTVFIVLIYVAALVLVGLDLRVDIDSKGAGGSLISPNLVDGLTTWSLFGLTLIMMLLVVALMWTAVLRSEPLCRPILSAISQHLLITRTTRARLQMFTLANSLILIAFQFAMLLLVYFIGAVLDEAFLVGIYAQENHVTSDVAVIGVMVLWTILWIIVAETLVASQYLSTASHVWHQFFERNFYFSKQAYHEHFCDCRSCTSVSQFGVAFHGGLRLFSRMGRLLYFSCATLCSAIDKWPLAPRLSEAIYSVTAYYCGAGFSRAARIFDELTDLSEANEDSLSSYSVITAASGRGVRYSTTPPPDPNKEKLEMCERNLKNTQDKIGELERKIAELADLEKEQEDKKTQIKVVRELAANKEANLKEKEGEVRYVLNTLMGEFEKTQNELGDALDRQRVFEIKKMTNPPDAVKLTIEAVACLLGEKDLEWNNLRVFIVKDTFVPSLTSLDADTVKLAMCKLVQSKYFNERPNFTFEKVNRASKTCGFLFRWLEALTKFTIERERIKPMLAEVDKLSADLEKLRSDDEALRLQVAEQDAKIAGIRLQVSALKKHLEAMKSHSDSLSIEKSEFEKLAKEAPEDPGPTITIEEQFAGAIEADKVRREKSLITKNLTHFIWTITCLSHVFVISLCVLGLSVGRGFLAVLDHTLLSPVYPTFYAIPLMLIFCLLFTINSSVISTFESAVHTCAVAALIHLSESPDKRVSVLCITDKENMNKKLPRSIDEFVISVLQDQDSDDVEDGFKE